MDKRRENQDGRLEYFHLHWPRNENFFSEGEKILSVRKCATPTFIFTNEPAYVMMSFNVIKSSRFNMKYLTALLNSKLIEYWLRNKGKMQGNNFQIDKEPLLAIPLINPAENSIKKISNLVSKVIDGKSIGTVTHQLEKEIDYIIYRLYDLNYLDVKVIDPKFNLSEEEYKTIPVD
jgi:adenine-specific DNA-methyltransferase